jgi:CYTH domain-containing protein
MGKEIERKFIAKSMDYSRIGAGKLYHQGYIPTRNGMTVRVRIAGDKGYLTLKDRVVGFSRNEFEYEIPLDDARQMLQLLCEPRQIEKIRYRIPTSQPGLVWEVDEFLGDNQGLILAEMEVPSEETLFDLPDWIEREVTGNHGYNNNALAAHPYKEWTTDEKANGPILK